MNYPATSSEMLNARFKSLNSLCSQFQFAKMMAVTLISKLCPRKIKLWMKIQFNEQILPLVVLGLNIAWTVLISIPPLIWTDLLSVFGVTLSSGSEVISMPIHLMYSTIDEDRDPPNVPCSAERSEEGSVIFSEFSVPLFKGGTGKVWGTFIFPYS